MASRRPCLVVEVGRALLQPSMRPQRRSPDARRFVDDDMSFSHTARCSTDSDALPGSVQRVLCATEERRTRCRRFRRCTAASGTDVNVERCA